MKASTYEEQGGHRLPAFLDNLSGLVVVHRLDVFVAAQQVSRAEHELSECA